jgi:hypothetical protein
MKKVGYTLTIIAVLVIVYNVRYVPYRNRNTVNEHPVITAVTLGNYLEKSYAFRPPFAGFELTVLGVGVLGIALIIIASVKEKHLDV